MTLMTLTENEFKSILPLSIKNNPLYNSILLYIACKINSIELLKDG
jgi:hypothetical protein